MCSGAPDYPEVALMRDEPGVDLVLNAPRETVEE